MIARTLAVALLLLCASGCRRDVPIAADPDRATKSLKVVLDAWKRGEKPESLLSHQPPIHVGDAEWAGGKKLIDYEIVKGQTAGFGWRCDVLLTVESEDRQARQHPAMYRIDTEPAVVVIHEE